MKRKLKDIAKVIRSKNSGPFELTMDILFANAETYLQVLESKVITKQLIADLYQIPLEKVLYLEYFDSANAIKITIVRSIDSGSIGETDVLGTQQHVPIMNIEIPGIG